MKTDSREASSIIELIQQYAVCYAGIRFMMINNGVTLFTTNGDGDSYAVIKTLYPSVARNGLLPVEHDHVSGYVSDPGSTMSTRKGQLFFVNGRLVSSALIEKGLEEGYQGRIFSGFPAAVLFIEAEPCDIDVNIHPGKQEIRFLRQEEVKNNISEAVSRAVMTDSGVPKGFVKGFEKGIEKAPEKQLNIAKEINEGATNERTQIRGASELNKVWIIYPKF
jgi:DNA mismatch repair protein MutL